MREDELAELMDEDMANLSGVGRTDIQKGGRNNSAAGEKGKITAKGEETNGDSSSEITVYKMAVRISGEQEKNKDKIEKFINNIRIENANGESCNISTSSEEFMDTSEESEVNQIHEYIAGSSAVPRKSADLGCSMEPRKTPEDHAAEIIKEAEKSKARMYKVPGRSALSISQIDEDYQMVDAHIDEVTRRKIQSLEYVDLRKLLPKQKMGIGREEDQHMEIVSRNGFTYLSPISEREAANINSYGKWEQAFRIYSNVLTSKMPGKSTELLQYGHTIHTAAMSYHWDNVYSYDKEFRQHIGHHLSRTWSVILQQAWTMLLKDRIRNNSNHLFQKGNLPGSKSNKKEPCRHFNRGKCTFGLSCKFDHRGSVPKCGKFGHGTHICRLRDSSPDKTVGNSETAATSK